MAADKHDVMVAPGPVNLEIALPKAQPAVIRPSAELPRLLQSWQQGQLLNALVLADSGKGAATLQIAGQALQAKASVALPVGQQVLLEVTRPGPLPHLRVVQPALTDFIARVASALRENLPQQQPLKPLLDNLQTLVRPGSGKPATAPPPATLQQAAERLLSGLPTVRTLTTPSGVQQAIRDSGIFLESRLADLAVAARNRPLATAQQSTPPAHPTPAAGPLAGDLKAGLLQVLAAVRGAAPTLPATATATSQPAVIPVVVIVPRATGAGSAVPTNPVSTLTTAITAASAALSTPAQPVPLPRLAELPQPIILPQARPGPTASAAARSPELARMMAELLAQTEGALARIQSRQLTPLAAVGGEERVQQNWSMELPVRHGQQLDLFELHIEHDAREGSSEYESTWSVVLNFNLGSMGPVRAKITLQGDRVSTVFWPQQTSTLAQFNARLPTLCERFEDAGLTVGHVGCRNDSPPAAGLQKPVQAILNERA